MKSKSTRKLASLKLTSDQILNPEACKSLKGGGLVWCCAQNRWVESGSDDHSDTGG